jgi:hypothetical protein
MAGALEVTLDDPGNSARGGSDRSPAIYQHAKAERERKIREIKIKDNSRWIGWNGEKIKIKDKETDH